MRRNEAIELRIFYLSALRDTLTQRICGSSRMVCYLHRVFLYRLPKQFFSKYVDEKMKKFVESGYFCTLGTSDGTYAERSLLSRFTAVGIVIRDRYEILAVLFHPCPLRMSFNPVFVVQRIISSVDVLLRCGSYCRFFSLACRSTDLIDSNNYRGGRFFGRR